MIGPKRTTRIALAAIILQSLTPAWGAQADTIKEGRVPPIAAAEASCLPLGAVPGVDASNFVKVTVSNAGQSSVLVAAVLLTPDRVIVPRAFVNPGQTYQVTQGALQVGATLASASEDHGIAMLALDRPLEAPQFPRAENAFLDEGRKIYLLNVEQTNREFQLLAWLPKRQVARNFLILDEFTGCTARPGPAFKQNGHLAGWISFSGKTAVLEGQESLLFEAQKLRRSGRLIQRGLGISGMDMTPELADAFEVPGVQGVLLSRVDPSGRAAINGLKEHDVLTHINGTPFAAWQVMLTLFQNPELQQPMVFSGYRNGKPRTWTVAAPPVDVD